MALVPDMISVSLQSCRALKTFWNYIMLAFSIFFNFFFFVLFFTSTTVYQWKQQIITGLRVGDAKSAIYAGRIHNSFRAEHWARLGEVCCPKRVKSDSIDDDVTLKKMEGKIINLKSQGSTETRLWLDREPRIQETNLLFLNGTLRRLNTN